MHNGRRSSRIDRAVGEEPVSNFQRSRLMVGLLLIVIAALLFVFGAGGFSTAGIIAIGVLGLISVAISRRK
jgi:hypothetical protein